VWNAGIKNLNETKNEVSKVTRVATRTLCNHEREKEKTTHMDGSVMFDRWRQCAPHLMHACLDHPSAHPKRQPIRFSHFRGVTSVTGLLNSSHIQLVTWPTRHSANSSHGQLVIQPCRHTVNSSHSQLVTQLTRHNSSCKNFEKMEN